MIGLFMFVFFLWCMLDEYVYDTYQDKHKTPLLNRTPLCYDLVGKAHRKRWQFQRISFPRKKIAVYVDVARFGKNGSMEGI